jgi:hypothetical protein
VAELVGTVHRVDRHHHRIGPHDAVEGCHELRAVLHEQQHPVALADATRAQPAGDALGLLLQFREAQIAAEEAVRGLVRVARGADLEVEPEGGLGHDQFARQAHGPDGMVGAGGGTGHGSFS